MIESTGHYCGRIADDRGVVWLLYGGKEVEHGMAFELIAVRADDTRQRWHGTIWILNLLVTSPDGWDERAGRGSAFFTRLREHFASAVKGDPNPMATSPHAFHAPTSTMVH